MPQQKPDPKYKYPNEARGREYNPMRGPDDIMNDPLVEHKWVTPEGSKIGHEEYTGPEHRQAARDIMGISPSTSNPGDIDLPLSKGNKPDPRLKSSAAMRGLRNAK